MDTAALEPASPQLHGLVRAARARRGARRTGGALGWRIAFAALAAGSLLAGLAGGLLRLGLQPLGAAAWLGQAAAAHGALMICGFFGLAIGIERAVALRHRWTFAVPALAGATTAAYLWGAPQAGVWLAVAASGAFVGVNLLVLRRQPAAHTALLAAAAAAWFAGSLAHALGSAATAVLPLWFAFLVVTIAAERLEMTRMMRRRAGAFGALLGILGALATGSAWAFSDPATGGVAYGLALAMLALWLGLFDVARRTVHAGGLTRYMAVCLLAGYAWLAAGGVAWAAMALGAPTRDLALHAIGLGFVFSMVMGHAPVILPAVARVKLEYGPWFYLPLALLHGTLLWRLGPGMADFAARAQGAAGNALALLLFAASMAGAAVLWRRRHPA